MTNVLGGLTIGNRSQGIHITESDIIRNNIKFDTGRKIMLSKAASEANQILSKIDDFKYFVLLGTFVMMLDSALIYSNNISLLKIKWSEVESTITIGDALVFICFFSLYITFIITTIRLSILAIASILPLSIRGLFNSDKSTMPSKQNYVSIWKLKSIAIRTNNPIAYDVLKTKQQSKDSRTQLERYCLAFLVASVVNIFSSAEEVKSLITTMSLITDMNDMTPIESIKFLLCCLLYLGMFKIGVLDGCGFIYDHSDEYYVYLPKDE